LLTGLFFKLGVEQRMREIGVLRTLGFAPAKIRNLFLAEGAALSLAGAGIGMGPGVGYAALVFYGLRTLGVGAVGTRSISLPASVPSLVGGAVAGALTALAAIAWTLRRLQAVTPRGLVSGEQKIRPGRWRVWVALAAIVFAAAMLAAPDRTMAFFGAGVLLL